MNDLQKVELNNFKEFDRIARKYKLTYFAIGGTCIGAIRHKGFIPWDDDIDVAMPYDDFLKFIEVCKKELKTPYSLYMPEGHPHWFRNFIKLQNDDTTFAEPDTREYADRFTGVYLDIMPLYGMPIGKFRQMLYSGLNDYYHYMNRRHYFPYTNMLKILNWHEKLVTFFHFKEKNDIHIYMNLHRKRFGKIPYNNSNKILFGWRDKIDIRYLPFNYKTVFDLKDFESTVEVPFEDTTIFVPNGYDHYLTQEFGDYMTLPPAEKRINHPTALIDLEKPYSYYMEGGK